MQVSATLTLTTYFQAFCAGMYLNPPKPITVTKRDVEKDIQNPAVHARSFTAFYYYDIATTTVEVKGRPVKLISEPCNASGIYFLASRVVYRGDPGFTEAESAYSSSIMQREGVPAGGWKAYAYLNHNQYYPFDDSIDRLIDPSRLAA